MVDYQNKNLIEFLIKTFNDIGEKQNSLNLKVNEYKANRNNIYFAYPNLRKCKLLFPAHIPLKSFLKSLEIYPDVTLTQKLKKQVITSIKLVNDILPISLNKIRFSSQGSCAKDLYKYFLGNVNVIDTIDSFSIKVGSIGRGLKVVAQFQDKEGNIVSYIKIGDNSERAKFLLNEHNILTFLNTNSILFSVPKVIGLNKSDSFTSLEISPIHNPTYRPRPSIKEIVDILSEFFDYKNNFQSDVKKYNEMDGLTLIDDDKVLKLIRQSIFTINQINYRHPLCHCDLTFWHTLRDYNNKIYILDWEFGKYNHLPFQDLFHYLLHSTINLSRKSLQGIYEDLFLRNKIIKLSLLNYSKKIGIEASESIFSFFIVYLFDWYKFERSRAIQNSNQGWRHLEFLKLLANKPELHFHL